MAEHRDGKTKELREKRQKAYEYFQANGLPKLFEDLLNTVYYEQPHDMWAYVSEYFKKFAKAPKFMNFEANLVYSGTGFNAVTFDTYFMNVGKRQLLHSTLFQVNICLCDDMSTVNNVIQFIEQHLTEALKDCDVFDLQAADERIESTLSNALEENAKLAQQRHDVMQPTEVKKEDKGIHRNVSVSSMKGGKRRPSEDRTLEDVMRRKSIFVKKGNVDEQLLRDDLAFRNCAFAASTAVWISVAELLNVAAHQLVAKQIQSKHKKCCNQWMMIPILTNSKLTPGKLNLITEAGFIFSSSEISASDIIKRISKAALEVQMQKYGNVGLLMTSNGTFVNTMDRLEQPLEMLQEMLNLAGSDVQNVGFFISASQNDCFDLEKLKYEVIKGIFKSGEELAEQYFDLLKKFPPINCIIDPFHDQDDTGLVKFKSMLDASEETLLKPRLYSVHTGKDVDNVIKYINSKDNAYNGIIFHAEFFDTVTDVLRFLNDIGKEETQLELVMSIPFDGHETFVIDLALGMGINGVLLSAMFHIENCFKINRWLKIRNENLSEPCESEEVLSTSPIYDASSTDSLTSRLSEL